MSETLENQVSDGISVDERDIVPLKQKLAYGMGVVSDHYATVCLSIFMFPFFNDFLKLGATSVGTAMAIARVWDAFTDPLAGALSDKCQSKYGRRRPFIFVGVILTGLFFPTLWLAPQTWTTDMIFYYLTAALLIYHTVYSIFSVPYESLGTELTADYKERTNIYVVRSYVQQTFNLGIIWVFPLATWIGMQLQELNGVTELEGNISGVRYVSILVGLMIMCSGVLPAIFCVERYGEIAKKINEKKSTFFETIASLMKNKPLWMVIGIIATYLLTIISTMSLAYYVNAYYIYGGEVHEGAKLGAYDGTLRFLFAIGSAWSIKKLSNKFQKHHLMTACVLILFCAFTGMYFTILPGKPLLSLTMKPFLAIAEVGFWILIISMRADVCDWDEYICGKRREGLISAACNWVNKLTISGALLLGGFLLEHVVKFNNDYDPQDRLTVKNEHALVTLDERAKIVKEEGKEYGEENIVLAKGTVITLAKESVITLPISTKVSKEIASKNPEEGGSEADKTLYAAPTNEVLTAEYPGNLADQATIVLTQDATYNYNDEKFVVAEDKNAEAVKIFGTIEKDVAVLDKKPSMPPQAEGTMEKLKAIYTLMPCGALVFSFILLVCYPLTSTRLKQVREELEARRGKTVTE